MKERNDSSDTPGIDIEECRTISDIEAAYPIMHQLRDALDLTSYLTRVDQARAGGYRLFCARMKGDIVGVMGLRFQSDLCWGRNLYVDDLVVDEVLRSRRIGAALMGFAAKLARQHNCDYVRLASGTSRTRVHGFYERLGYRKTSFTFALDCKA